MGAEGLEAVEVQNEPPMPRRGLLGIEMEFDLFQPEACPAGHVFNIPGVKRPRREEALARFEVAASQQKPKLIGGRAQVRGGLLDCLGEIKILLALETIKHGGRLEGFLLDGVENIHSRHGRPPDKVVPEPEWPERARIQHVRIYKEPWYVSPKVTGPAVSTFSAETEENLRYRKNHHQEEPRWA